MEVDPNSWYRLADFGNPRQSLTSLYRGINSTTGQLVLSSSNDNTPDQQWQLFSLGSFKYVLRTKASGPSGYLALDNVNETCDNSGLETHVDANADSSLLWAIRAAISKNTIQLSTSVQGSECYIGLESTGGVRAASKASQFVLSRIGSINDTKFSSINAAMTIRTQLSSLTSSTAFTTSSHSHSIPTSTPTTLPSTPHTPSHPRLSASTTTGISVAAAIVGCILIVTTALWIYRCWKVRQLPAVRDYRRARLWQGFVPATPSTATTTLIDGKMAKIYFVDLPTPATPAFALSPPPLNEYWPMSPVPRTTTLPSRGSLA
jgi:hypothetical protein